MGFADALACCCVAFPPELAEGVQNRQAVVVTVPQALFAASTPLLTADHAGISIFKNKQKISSKFSYRLVTIHNSAVLVSIWVALSQKEINAHCH